MGLKSKESINWEWVNANKKLAIKFEKEHATKNLTDCLNVSSLHIKPSDFHVDIGVTYAKKLPKNTLSCPLSLNQSPDLFEDKLIKALRFFSRKVLEA